MAKRPRHPVPAYVTAAIAEAGVRDDFAARPPYQRNDYVGWITRAKTEAARDKRLRQMLRELKQGGVYMGMAHAPSAKAAPRRRNRA